MATFGAHLKEDIRDILKIDYWKFIPMADYILTKKEFMKEPEGKACVRETRIVAIISYVLNIIFAILAACQRAG